ncbi:MAG: cell division protein FtsZ [Candidatus Paceibacterota bacterium]
MAKITTDVETFARIKVVGVGGSGGNAVNHMIASKVKEVGFIVMNTDTQDLHKSLADRKIHLGKNLTKGLGAGMNPEIGKKAAEETKSEIQDILKGTDMVFIACGMGGGTGTGAAPIVARAAKEQGILTVAVVTKPFFFEGQHRQRLAEQGIKELEKEVDAIVIIPNDRLSAITEKETTLKDAFAMSDDILRQAVEGISDLITTPGIINVDFADIKAIMSDAGSALMGIGRAAGDNRAEEAALKAINSPLLEISINGARGVLFSVAGGEDLGLQEVQSAAKIITESIDKDARVIFGTTKDEKLKKGEIQITVIATGFPTGSPKKSISQSQNEVSIQKQLSSIREEKKDDQVATKQKKTIEEFDLEDIMPKHNSREAIEIIDGDAFEDDEEDEDDDDDKDDWSAVPAFLRRKK